MGAIFFVMGHPSHFCLFFLFKHKFYRKIRTWIVRVEGKHADHLTTSTAQWELYLDHSMSLCHTTQQFVTTETDQSGPVRASVWYEGTSAKSSTLIQTQLKTLPNINKVFTRYAQISTYKQRIQGTIGCHYKIPPHEQSSGSMGYIYAFMFN